MKFLIINVFDGGEHCGASFKDVNDLTVQSKIDYCEKHGYDFLNIDKNLDTSRLISWSKTKAAIENLDKYDWIWCTDSDLIIMNDDVSLNNLVDNNYDIIVAQNHHTNGEIEINTGSILIRNSEWNKTFLDRVYDQDQFSMDGWAEQRSMMYLLATDPTVKPHFKLVDFRLFNSTYKSWDEYNYKQGDFVFHLAGCGNLERIYVLKTIQKHDKKTWSLDLLKKDGNLSVYRNKLHECNPFKETEINHWKPTNDPGGLDLDLFKDVLLYSGGDAVNLIVEVGSWLGGSAITMANYLKTKKNVHTDILCVDNWCGSVCHWEIPEFKKIMQLKNGRPTIYEQFVKNIKYLGLDDYIIPFHINSIDAARFLIKKNIQSDIVFIDASHEENDVYQDISIHWQHLKPGGTMIGDDYEPAYPGVVNAVHRFAQEKRLKVLCFKNDWILQKYL